jgi:hypothetical protein
MQYRFARRPVGEARPERNHKYFIFSYGEGRDVFMKVGIFAAVFFLTAACALDAQIMNGGFEADANTPASWESSGRPAEIRQSFTTFDSRGQANITLLPFEGQNFVLLKSGGGTPDTNHGQLSQQITVEAGQTLSGVFFFAAGDYIPFNDTATIRLVPELDSGLVEIMVAQKTVADVGDYGAMQNWEVFTHTFTELEAGNYTLVLKVSDLRDDILSSYLCVDDVTITPEPATMLLLGFGMLATRLRRKPTR